MPPLLPLKVTLWEQLRSPHNLGHHFSLKRAVVDILTWALGTAVVCLGRCCCVLATAVVCLARACCCVLAVLTALVRRQVAENFLKGGFAAVCSVCRRLDHGLDLTGVQNCPFHDFP